MKIQVTHSIPPTSQYFDSMNGHCLELAKTMNDRQATTQRQLDALVADTCSSFVRTIGRFKVTE